MRENTLSLKRRRVERGVVCVHGNDARARARVCVRDTGRLDVATHDDHVHRGSRLTISTLFFGGANLMMGTQLGRKRAHLPAVFYLFAFFFFLFLPV